MSWSPDLFIGELRPWPDTVHVVRGKTDEMRRYVPEEMLFHERDGHDEQFERARSLEDENARLRSCLTDDAENARMIMAENAKLRELVRIAGTYCVNGLCGKDDGCPLYLGKPYCALHDRMRELGVEDPSRWATCECGEDVELFEGCHEAVCPSCGRVVMDDAQEG